MARLIIAETISGELSEGRDKTNHIICETIISLSLQNFFELLHFHEVTGQLVEW